jgi:hypothetical protein
VPSTTAKRKEKRNRNNTERASRPAISEEGFAVKSWMETLKRDGQQERELHTEVEERQ